MKNLLLFLRLFLCFGSAIAVAQHLDWDWAASGVLPGNQGEFTSRDMAVDSAGNVYICGEYTDQPGSYYSDLFLAKYNNAGALVWQKIVGSARRDQATAINLDKSGNPYIAGTYGDIFMPDTANFDISFGAYTLQNRGWGDVFVVKYDPAGDVLWAKSFGGPYRDIARGISVDEIENVYITGSFLSPSVQDTSWFGNTGLTSEGDVDAFFAMLSPSGTVIWARNAGGHSNDHGFSVKVGSAGFLYLAGMFDDYIVFDSQTTTSLSSGFMGGDVFIAKYDTSGTRIWVRQIGGAAAPPNPGAFPGILDCRDLSLSDDGDIYIAGYYEECTLQFHNGTQLNSFQETDVFVAKYSPSGDLKWAKGFGGGSEDYCHGLAVDEAENVYLTGEFGVGLKFGADSLWGGNLSNIFLAKLDSSGNSIWAIEVSGQGGEHAYAVTCMPPDNTVYITGPTVGAPLTFGTHTVNQNGEATFFLAKASGYSNSVAHSPQLLTPLHAFPNPVKHDAVLTIRSSSRSGTIRLLDPLGKLLYESNAGQSVHQVDLSTLSLTPGTYFLRLQTPAGSQTQKLLIY